MQIGRQHFVWLTAEIPTGNSPKADQFCHPTLPITLSLGVISYSALAIVRCGSFRGILIFGSTDPLANRAGNRT